MEPVWVSDVHSAIGALRRLAEDSCEGCRLVWRMNGDHHTEPMPTRCTALNIRAALVLLHKST